MGSGWWIVDRSKQRPGQWETPYGRFSFRHVQTDFFYGFSYRAVGHGERAFVATPEKALLDLIYLQPGGDDPAFLGSLRLQNLDILDLERLFAFAERLGKPKLARAAAIVADLATAEARTYQTL